MKEEAEREGRVEKEEEAREEQCEPALSCMRPIGNGAH
jgi:hypothetical protein